jgi:methylmalonyl-CoA/ethylmalonyl-CoA epimerase
MTANDTTRIRLGPISQILVPVSDVDRATAWYRDTLGIPFLFAFPGMAFLDAGGVRLYLASPSEEGFAGPVTIYFRVADIHAAADDLQARGVVFAGPPHMIFEDDGQQTWLCFSKDPDGNNIALMSEVRPGG